MMYQHEMDILTFNDNDFDIQIALCMVRNASITGETTASPMDITHCFITRPTDIRITCKILIRVKDRLWAGLRNHRFVQMSKPVGEHHRQWGVTAGFVLQMPALRTLCGLTETAFRPEESVVSLARDDVKSQHRGHEDRTGDADRRKYAVDIPILAAQRQRASSTSEVVEHASVYDHGEWPASSFVPEWSVSIYSNEQTCVHATSETISTPVTRTDVKTMADDNQQESVDALACSLLNKVKIATHDSAIDSACFPEATDSDSSEGSEPFSVRYMKRCPSQDSVGSASLASTESGGMNTRWIPVVKRSFSLDSIESHTSTEADSAWSTSDDESSENGESLDNEEVLVKDWAVADTGYKLCGVDDRQQSLLNVIRWTSFEDLLTVLRIQEEEERKSGAVGSGLYFTQHKPPESLPAEEAFEITASFRYERENCTLRKTCEIHHKDEDYNAKAGESGLCGNQQEERTNTTQQVLLSTKSAEEGLKVDILKHLHELTEEKENASPGNLVLHAVQAEALEMSNIVEQAFLAAMSTSLEDDLENVDQQNVIGTHPEEEESGKAVGPALFVIEGNGQETADAVEQTCLTSMLNSVRDSLKNKDNRNIIEQAFWVAMSASSEADIENLDASFGTLDIGEVFPDSIKIHGETVDMGQPFRSLCSPVTHENESAQGELSEPKEQKSDTPSPSEDDILNNNTASEVYAHVKSEYPEQASNTATSADTGPEEVDQSSPVKMPQDAREHQALCLTPNKSSDAEISIPVGSLPSSPETSELNVPFNERMRIEISCSPDCSVDSLDEDFKMPTFSDRRRDMLKGFASPLLTLPSSDRLDCATTSSRTSFEDSNQADMLTPHPDNAPDSTQWPFSGIFTTPLSKAITEESAEASKWLEEHSVDSSSYSPTIAAYNCLGSTHRRDRLFKPRKSLFSFAEYSNQTRIETFGRQADTYSFGHQEDDSLQYGDCVLMSSTPATLALGTRADLATELTRDSVAELSESEISFGFTERL